MMLDNKNRIFQTKPSSNFHPNRDAGQDPTLPRRRSSVKSFKLRIAISISTDASLSHRSHGSNRATGSCPVDSKTSLAEMENKKKEVMWHSSVSACIGFFIIFPSLSVTKQLCFQIWNVWRYELEIFRSTCSKVALEHWSGLLVKSSQLYFSHIYDLKKNKLKGLNVRNNQTKHKRQECNRPSRTRLQWQKHKV